MKESYYVILKRDDYFYFPVKVDDHSYCGGMPQFFGGGKRGNENWEDCINRELGEESDWVFSNARNLEFVHQGTDNYGNNYLFFLSRDFEGNFDGTRRDVSNTEMQCILKLHKGQICNLTSLENLLKSESGEEFTFTEEFNHSQTINAFREALSR